MCALAPIAVAATLLAGPMCPRTDRGPVPTMDLVMAALRGEVPPSATAATDPQFETAIRAIRAPAPQKPAPRRRHRR
ncbi:hypothetical protein [Methylobacterium sp. ID0610]|uniref:hypothetical protein n=1 Tax=Methylobacterium carpenticola TaxID=3344827 RepID=UPI00367BC402